MDIATMRNRELALLSQTNSLARMEIMRRARSQVKDILRKANVPLREVSTAEFTKWARALVQAEIEWAKANR